MSHKDSPAPHHVVAVLENVKGIFLLKGAYINVAQHISAAPLTDPARQEGINPS